jgi:hypothetical protein
MDKTLIIDIIKTVLNDYISSKYVTVTFDEAKTIVTIFTSDFIDKLGIIEDVKSKTNIDIIVNLVQGDTYLLQKVAV